jgi:hypothetical protein
VLPLVARACVSATWQPVDTWQTCCVPGVQQAELQGAAVGGEGLCERHPRLLRSPLPLQRRHLRLCVPQPLPLHAHRVNVAEVSHLPMSGQYRVKVVPISCQSRVNVVLMSFQFRVNLVSISCQYRVNIMSISCQCRVNVVSISCRCRVNVVSISCQSCVNFVSISCQHNVNIAEVSHISFFKILLHWLNLSPATLEIHHLLVCI